MEGIFQKMKKKDYIGIEKAAIYGNSDAQIKLARYYYINKNERKSFGWYLNSANKRSFFAICVVAQCYRDGVGTDKNLVEATKWYQIYKSEIDRKFDEEPLVTLNNFLNGSKL